MELTWHTDKLAIKVEGKDSKDVFTSLAGVVEVFSHTVCGACDSTSIIPIVREKDGNHYYEMKCRDCGAVLAYGQKRADGTLFPKRKDKEGNWLPNRGWVKWSGSKAQDDDWTKS